MKVLLPDPVRPMTVKMLPMIYRDGDVRECDVVATITCRQAIRGEDDVTGIQRGGRGRSLKPSQIGMDHAPLGRDLLEAATGQVPPLGENIDAVADAAATMSMSCSTMTKVMPSSRSARMTREISARIGGLTPAAGSSSRMTFGSSVGARASRRGAFLTTGQTAGALISKPPQPDALQDGARARGRRPFLLPNAARERECFPNEFAGLNYPRRGTADSRHRRLRQARAKSGKCARRRAARVCTARRR